MNAIKKARQLITQDPTQLAARTLANLVLALESDTEFSLASLYALDLKSFGLAMDILSEWRLDRYYAQKSRLLDVSYQTEQFASLAAGLHIR